MVLTVTGWSAFRWPVRACTAGRTGFISTPGGTTELNKSSSRSLRIGGLFAVLAALLLGLAAMAGPASATTADSSNTTPQVVSWTAKAGLSYSARALTAAEIKARGLDKYIDMSTQAVTTPTLVRSGASGGKATPSGTANAVQRTGAKASPMASGCWSYWFGYGTFSGLQLWGKTDVTWCGDGTWVTYSTSNCYGYSNYPTYAYLGCSNYPNYGSGWNLYQVKTQWTLCPAWVPVWGSCAYTTYPWEQYQFLGSGAVLWNGGS